MFTILRVGVYTLGIFHLFTDAFFMAVLFLDAGSVITSMQHEQDMRNMGRLWRRFPFTLGMAGVILNRKNIIVVLMSVELILLSVNINLVAFSAFLCDLTGQVFALFILTVAAAEAAIGLAILVTYYRNRGSIAVEDINLMKG